MSAIRGLIRATISLLRKLKGMSREELLARCDGLKRQLELRGMSLLRQADKLHREAVFYAKRKMLKAAKASLEAWSEYKSEAESCIMMARLYDRIRLRVMRAASLRDITRISELVADELDKLLGELPDDPVSARCKLEGAIENLDSMMMPYTESTVSPEVAAEVEEELSAIMMGEVGMTDERRAAPEPTLEIAPPRAEEEKAVKVKSKKEEIEEELKRIKAMVGI